MISLKLPQFCVLSWDNFMMYGTQLSPDPSKIEPQLPTVITCSWSQPIWPISLPYPTPQLPHFASGIIASMNTYSLILDSNEDIFINNEHPFSISMCQTLQQTDDFTSVRLSFLIYKMGMGQKQCHCEERTCNIPRTGPNFS